MGKSLFLALFVLAHFPAQADTIIPAFSERSITPADSKSGCITQSGENMSFAGDCVSGKDVFGELVKFLLPDAVPEDTAVFESPGSRVVGSSV